MPHFYFMCFIPLTSILSPHGARRFVIRNSFFLLFNVQRSMLKDHVLSSYLCNPYLTPCTLCLKPFIFELSTFNLSLFTIFSSLFTLHSLLLTPYGLSKKGIAIIPGLVYKIEILGVYIVYKSHSKCYI